MRHVDVINGGPLTYCPLFRSHLEPEPVVALVCGPAADAERGEVHGAVLDLAQRRAQRLPARGNLGLPRAVRLAPTLLEP